jgi:hypothetical protein
VRTGPGRWLAALFAAACLAGVGGCGRAGDERPVIDPPGAAVQAGGAMGDEAFDKLELDTFEESACTPKLESDDFEGIRIAMPAKVPASRLDRLALCGVWSFNNTVLAKFPMVEDSLVFLARNVETHESATGNFRVHKDPASTDEMKAAARENPAPAPPGADSDPVIGDEDITARGYFNFNLGRVWDVPARPGRWRVQLVLHDIHSNEVEFEVVK